MSSNLILCIRWSSHIEPFFIFVWTGAELLNETEKKVIIKPRINIVDLIQEMLMFVNSCAIFVYVQLRGRWINEEKTTNYTCIVQFWSNSSQWLVKSSMDEIWIDNDVIGFYFFWIYSIFVRLTPKLCRTRFETEMQQRIKIRRRFYSQQQRPRSKLPSTISRLLRRFWQRIREHFLQLTSMKN